MKYKLYPLPPDQTDLVYSASTDGDRKNGCIGHLRFDMGHNGKEFWSSWWQHQPELQTSEFRAELNKVINGLRTKSGPLYDLNNMVHYCYGPFYDHPADSDRRSFGCRVDTDRYSFLFRLSPHAGDYSYCYCYDRQAQRAQEQPSVLAQLRSAAEGLSKAPTAPEHDGMER